jgi:Nuclease-related domain
METHTVQVFLGDPIEDNDERRVLNRLRTDLSRRGISARIYANLVATGKQQRQVDLLVVTADRCVQAEVKNLAPDLPLIGSANGPWRQVLPGGQERQLDRNYFCQAREATYAISDVMRALARRDDVPDDGPFYRHVDTVVCLHPGIPAGSKLDRFEHVAVIGYDELVDRLAAPGPRPGWGDPHWDAFARHLGLYRESRESPSERARRQSLTVVEDYRRRFTASLGMHLHEFVPVTARVDGTTSGSPLDAIVAAAAAGGTVTVTGPSGGGKSHAARHAALTLTAQGQLPVWMRCSEYAKGRFSVLLARAAAPYTVDRPLELMRRAWDAGAVPALILDGLNECPATLAGELLEQLAAARLRLPCGVIITSVNEVPLPDEHNVCHVELQLPGPAERQALLSSYGAAACPAPNAFRTPLELVLAAECAAELGPGPTAADLFDAYVRRRAGSPVRGALRLLAAEMDAQVRSSLTVPETTLLLERAGTRPGAPAVDTVLGCPLLAVRQGRVSFTHEQFGRFLTAEHLVIDSADPAVLAGGLTNPRHTDLRAFAVAIERDDNRRSDLLLELADAGLLEAAEAGQFGTGVSVRVRGVLTGVLTEAKAATAAAELHPPAEAAAVHGAHWQMPGPRSAREAALLTVAGRCLRRGSYLPEVAALLDATDARCATEIRQLREEGYTAPVSAVIAATYCPGWSPASRRDCLPASIVVAACEQHWQGLDQPQAATAAAATVLQGAGSPARWGRLYLALELADPDSDEDLAYLPSLVQAAWQARGYHLRLKALDTAHRVGRRLDEHTRARLAEVLESFDVSGNIMLSSILVEALAACDALEPMNTLDQIRAEIEAVLAEPDDPLAWSMASGIYYRQFEEEDVVGPYFAAVAELDDRRKLQLCVMAARAGREYEPGWVLREIADRAEMTDGAGREVLRAAATTVADSVMPQEAVQAHLEGLRGWARVAGALPDPVDNDGDIGRRAWRLVDELIFRLERGNPAVGEEAARYWQELLGRCAQAAVDVLFMVHSATALRPFAGPGPQQYERLISVYPDQVRALLQWGLPNRGRLVPTMRMPTDELPRYMIGELGRIGDAGTVALLHAYLPDPDLGHLAIEGIRMIERRSAGTI